MAYVNLPQKGNWRGRYQITVSYPNGYQATVKCEWQVQHVKNAGKLSRYHYRGAFDGTNGSTYYPTKAALGCDGNGNNETASLGSITKTYTRTHTDQTLSKSVKVTNTNTGTASSGTASFSIKARDSYVVNYFANGGTGDTSDTKWCQETLTLNDGSTFERYGYKIIGWNTLADGSGTHYELGGEYIGDEQLDLYAEWQLKEIKPFVKVDGEWTRASLRLKNDDSWINPHTAFVKVNGEWKRIPE